MPVPSTITDLSATAASNSPDGAVDLPSAYDDHIRALGAFIRQLKDGAEFPPLLTSVSGTNTITGTAPASISALSSGMTFRFVAAGDNTGAVTLNVNSIGATSITTDGTTALSAGMIKSGQMVTVTYVGSNFRLVNSGLPVYQYSDQTIYDAKTFDEPVTVPDATTDDHAVNKGQMDAAIDAAVAVGYATAATTSGTSITPTTSIPSNVIEINVAWRDLSTNGTSLYELRLGTSSGTVSTGYIGAAGQIFETDSISINTSTTGVPMYAGLGSASLVSTGSMQFTRLRADGSRWAYKGSAYVSVSGSDVAIYISGTVVFSGPPDRVTLLTINGTDQFDQGTLDVMWRIQ